MISLQWLSPDSTASFPAVETALKEPDGLLAAGGDLSTTRLINAYQNGIFPWFSEGEPLLWWSPDPRFVLFPETIKISRSLSKNLRNSGFRITMDQVFDQVVTHCASLPRDGQPGTWITEEMQQAYIRLHELGFAHSVECWFEDKLVGGLYGVHSGQVFCGESMFSLQSNASKVALVEFCRFLRFRGFRLIDSQVYTAHLESLGAKMIARSEYLKILREPLTIEMPKNWGDSFSQFIHEN